MTTTTLNWRTQDYPPIEECTIALLMFACDQDPNERFIYGVARSEAGQWIDEETGKPIACDRYWWVPECELVETLPK